MAHGSTWHPPHDLYYEDLTELSFFLVSGCDEFSTPQWPLMSQLPWIAFFGLSAPRAYFNGPLPWIAVLGFPAHRMLLLRFSSPQDHRMVFGLPLTSNTLLLNRERLVGKPTQTLNHTGETGTFADRIAMLCNVTGRVLSQQAKEAACFWRPTVCSTYRQIMGSFFDHSESFDWFSNVKCVFKQAASLVGR